MRSIGRSLSPSRTWPSRQLIGYVDLTVTQDYHSGSPNQGCVSAGAGTNGTWQGHFAGREGKTKKKFHLLRYNQSGSATSHGPAPRLMSPGLQQVPLLSIDITFYKEPLICEPEDRENWGEALFTLPPSLSSLALLSPSTLVPIFICTIPLYSP